MSKSDETKSKKEPLQLGGSITVHEGSISGRAMPTTGKPNDHIPNYPDFSAHSVLLNANAKLATDPFQLTGGFTYEYSVLNSGIDGKSPKGISTRTTAEMAIAPAAGPIDRVNLWYSQRSFDFETRPDRAVHSIGLYAAGEPVKLVEGTSLTPGVGVRRGLMDPPIAYGNLVLQHGKTFVEAGTVHALDTRNDQVFVGAGVKGQHCQGQVRYYADTNHENPLDATRAQWNTGCKLSEQTSVHSYGTVALGDSATLQEAMVGVQHTRGTITFTGEVGRNCGPITPPAAPKAPCSPSVQVTVGHKF